MEYVLIKFSCDGKVKPFPHPWSPMGSICGERMPTYKKHNIHAEMLKYMEKRLMKQK